MFQNYFDSAPVVCPVCVEWANVRMNCTGEVVTLLLRCERCGNRALLFFSGIIGLPTNMVHHEPKLF